MKFHQRSNKSNIREIKERGKIFRCRSSTTYSYAELAETRKILKDIRPIDRYSTSFFFFAQILALIMDERMLIASIVLQTDLIAM